ncbi:MAG: molybdopterin molybdotransferase [Chloroflexota bacterium]|nr:molybdopterin molybdotransferase [Chloroflexota bacterium]
MGRRSAEAEFENRVRQVRQASEISQAQLAERAGLTRQAISGIEGGRYVPNTTVALRLARALSCTVEELFLLPRTESAPPLELASTSSTSGTPSPRLAVGHVGDRWIGYPLGAGWELQPGFQSADLVRASAATDPGQLLTPLEQLDHTAIVLGCDPSLGILSAHLAARSSEAHVRWLSAASQVALDAVARGEAHVGGTHLPDPDGADYNLVHARRALGQPGGLVVELARWELGLAVPRGNPKGIGAVADLTHPDVQIVNRELGAGSRVVLDTLLARARIPTSAINGYDRLVGGHWAAAAVVASGGADAAVTLRASAAAAGLDFVPLDEVRFDLVIPRPHLDHPAVAALLELLQGAALRTEIGALAGYDVTGMGTVRATLAAS